MEPILLKISLVFLISCFLVKSICNPIKVTKALSIYKKSIINLKNSISLDLTKNNNEIEKSMDQILIKGINLLFKILEFSLPYILFYMFLKIYKIDSSQIIKLLLPVLPYLILLRKKL